MQPYYKISLWEGGGKVYTLTEGACNLLKITRLAGKFTMLPSPPVGKPTAPSQRGLVFMFD